MHPISMKGWSERTLKVKADDGERLPVGLWAESEFAVPVRRGCPETEGRLGRHPSGDPKSRRRRRALLSG